MLRDTSESRGVAGGVVYVGRADRVVVAFAADRKIDTVTAFVPSG